MNENIQIFEYSPAYKQCWDDLVRNSKNGTFLFLRDYMEYHEDRFLDCSYLFFKKGKPIALFPAARHDNELRSHSGLTYGGLVMDKKISAADVLDIFSILIKTAVSEGFTSLIYKTVPHIYHIMPAEEDLYALFRWDAKLISRNISSTIFLSAPLKFRDIRKSGIRKALKEGISIVETTDISAFWDILTTNLNEKYHCNPVHTLDEMDLLMSRFPHNIRVYTANSSSGVSAGVVVYESETVAHIQYISASPEGKSSGSLDLLFSWLITERYKDKRYLDFGISTEDGGHYLNNSLIYQKEGFGARGICYDTYKIKLIK